MTQQKVSHMFAAMLVTCIYSLGVMFKPTQLNTNALRQSVLITSAFYLASGLQLYVGRDGTTLLGGQHDKGQFISGQFQRVVMDKK